MQVTQHQIDKLANKVSELINRLDQSQSIQEIMDIEAFCIYTSLKKPYAYKLTSLGQVPHYKPRGSKIYFKKSEVDEWLFQNKVSSKAEIEQQVNAHLLAQGGA